MRAVQFTRVLVHALAIVALAGSAALVWPAVAGGQERAVDPRDIALTPADLPPGFVVTADATRSEALLVAVADTSPGEPLEHEEHDVAVRQVGVRFTTELRREPAAEDPRSGPITVGQTITRIDTLIVPADLLAEARDHLIRDEGFALLPDPPHDRTAVQLVKATERGVAYAVGVVKHDTVIVTSLHGPELGVDPEVALALAGKSAAKYDALASAASGSPPADSGPPTDRGAPADSGIEGQVFIGAACPGLEREGPECRDRPHQAAIAVLTDTGDLVTRVQSDEDGRFWVRLEPGMYVLRPEPSGLFSSADEQEVAVTRARFTRVRIRYDSGL